MLAVILWPEPAPGTGPATGWGLPWRWVGQKGAWDLGRIPLFSLALDKMAWLNKRQEVLAHNIANADTPDFPAAGIEGRSIRARPLSSVGAQATGAISP